MINFLIEVDGIIFEQSTAWYKAHVTASEAVGWSRLDSSTFWRFIRTKGRQADLLPAARSGKVEEYWTRFNQLIESNDSHSTVPLIEGSDVELAALARHGEIRMLTLGENVSARNTLLVSHGLARLVKQFERLDSDPRRRPAELKVLAKSNRRTLVVAASDTLIRSAGTAELTSVGISTGSCTAPRLHQAGASLVYKGLDDLVESLNSGAHDLIRAGLPPRSLDAPTQ